MKVQEFQDMIFDEIDNPEYQIYLRVQKKTLLKDEYLKDIRKRAEIEELSEEEIEDVLFLVEKALWGFGVLDYLINEDDTVSDIRLIDKDTVRVKRLGQREDTNISFASDEEYRKYIEFITSRNAVNLSMNNGVQVFTDKDNSPTNILRFSICADFLNTNDQPSLLIRKIPKIKKDFEKLISENFITEKQVEYLSSLWEEGESILVCGPNGSGKTTFINALLEKTNKKRSCVVMQESEELFCHNHPEMIFRKILPERNNSTIYYDLKSLGRIALMESFDTMVIGEIKGKEAANLAYATYTGSQCLTSVHSNSAAEGYDKLIDYALEEEKNRTRGHFAKQLKSLTTAVYVENYKIKEILHLKNYDAKTETFSFESAIIA